MVTDAVTLDPRPLSRGDAEDGGGGMELHLRISEVVIFRGRHAHGHPINAAIHVGTGSHHKGRTYTSNH